jgi:hypothetical protein
VGFELEKKEFYDIVCLITETSGGTEDPFFLKGGNYVQCWNSGLKLHPWNLQISSVNFKNGKVWSVQGTSTNKNEIIFDFLN